MKASTLVFLGMLSLAVGALVYLLDRPVGIFSGLGKGYASLSFGAVGDWLPDALHPFAMALLCAAVSGKDRSKSLHFWAIFWGGVGLFMETGQYYGEKAAAWMPPCSDRIRDYFVQGTFDPLDVMGIVAGSTLAWMLSLKKTGQGNSSQGILTL